MKKVFAIFIIILLIVIGFTNCKQSDTPGDGLIKVDILTTNYPKKELILQDFMDVEYIPLETNDEFVNQGFIQDIGKDIIVVRNLNDDGNIYIYDRNGKALRKINRKGQGGEEYTNIYNIILDEDNGEMFVNDIFTRKMLVYDLYGNFKRSFKHKEGGESMFYTDMFNYDEDHLICYDKYNEEISFVLVSKQDGRIAKDIQIPFKEKIEAKVSMSDGANGVYSAAPPYRSIIPYKDNWILLELSSDTVYTFSSDYSLQSIIVRTPPVQSMNPEVFLVLRLFSDRYYFMETIEKTYDFNTERGFPRRFFMYDKQEKTMFNYAVYNGDYTTKKEIYMNALSPVNHEIESKQTLQAYQLGESYKNGELKGKLKEIASTLKEDDNPVIMLVKHKK